MYICSTLSDGLCVEWVELSSVFGLSVEDGFMLGGMLFSISALAWGANFLLRFILNR